MFSKGEVLDVTSEKRNATQVYMDDVFLIDVGFQDRGMKIYDQECEGKLLIQKVSSGGN